jgi:hypothetical protein
MLRDGKGADTKTVLILFVIGCCASPFVFLVFARAFPGSEQSNPATLISIAISTCLTFSGVYSFAALRNTSDVAWRRVLLGLAQIAALLAVPLMLIGTLTGSLDALVLGTGAVEALASVLLMYAFAFLLVLALAFSFLFQAFGAVGLTMLALRRFLPWTIRSLRTEADAPLPVRKLVLWLFNIPYFLDPADLRTGPSFCQYSRRAFLRSVALVFILDLTFGIYLCLNPLFLQLLPLSHLFLIVTVLSLVVPLLVMWIDGFAAVGAHIPAGKRDLELARGLRNRALGVLVPLGTILIILRLTLQTMHWDSIFGLLTLLGIYLFFNVALGAAMMYVFYHYYERQAACFVDE